METEFTGWRPGTEAHDISDVRPLPNAYPADFRQLMSHIGGGITFEEACFLAEEARLVKTGCILEVGSFKGRSAVALSAGALAAGSGVTIYCIEPHQVFTGIFGGQFGPRDRAQFYLAMLATGAYRNTALINLSSEDVAPGWSRPISLCFIDGDHSYEGVRRDFDCWAPKISPGGLLILDDTRDSAGGPHRLRIEIDAMDCWKPCPAPGKFAAFRKS